MENIGKTISKYKLTRVLGEGGMAKVYEGVHETLGKKVAIKILNPILSANAQIRERFKNEATLIASLQHPNIVDIIDFVEEPNLMAIIMELLEGDDLNDYIKQNGAFNEAEMIALFSQVLEAFSFAHNHGIVHRDVKPSNIFILKSKQIKILDFGIAKLFGTGLDQTKTGTQMGTPLYMSPEQVKADKSIDHRSDIYSLGVTLYYMVSGKPPYNEQTESGFDIQFKIVKEDFPEYNGNSKINRIIQKATAKNRDERYQSCEEFLSDLKNEIKQPNISTSTIEKKESTSQKPTYKYSNTEAIKKNNASIPNNKEKNKLIIRNLFIVLIIGGTVLGLLFANGVLEI